MARTPAFLSYPFAPGLILPLALLIAACGPDTDATLPGDAGSNTPYDGIGMGDVLRFTGTEPFWGGKAKGNTLTYSTPEDISEQVITASRFAGRGGLSFSGTLREGAFTMAVTEGACSDGMSDRTYPFTVTLEIAGLIRQGCAWSDNRPFEGPDAP